VADPEPDMEAAALLAAVLEMCSDVKRLVATVQTAERQRFALLWDEWGASDPMWVVAAFLQGWSLDEARAAKVIEGRA